MWEYTVIVVPEEETVYSLEVPALPGCYRDGETKDENNRRHDAWPVFWRL